MEIVLAIIGSGILTKLLDIFYDHKKNKNKKEKDLSTAVSLLLCEGIQIRAKEHIANGFITMEDLKLIKEEFTEYKALGGNGYVDTVMKHVEGLEIKEV